MDFSVFICYNYLKSRIPGKRQPERKYKMIYRLVYTAQLGSGVGKEDLGNAMNAAVLPDHIVSASVMTWRERVFLYYESKDDSEITPEQLWGDLSGLLEAWPGEAEKRYWIRMYDIFHYNRPVDDTDWMRHVPSKPFGMLMKIRPEMLASYIFYHHQMQEETPGSGGKHGAIYMHENLLFHYLEDNDPSDGLCFKGKLDTHNTPSNCWGELMEQHFAPWPDTDPPIQWRKDVDLIYHKEKIVPAPSI